ncbi:MAG: NAD(P)/FAD-dependent oxidoreductase [Mucilaginibacter polytrichastri]|nr:NAD(P)/FAD-dependent oxidoreductase [Mucilaginibacter polytrichastri]
MPETDKANSRTDFDAIVVGSGPNGLAAAITLQQTGKSVLLVEGKGQIGGGLRTAQLTLPGFHHDICSAIHPMAAGSPFFQTLPLENFGLKYVHPEIPCAHPFDDGSAAVLLRSAEETAQTLGEDGDAYLRIIRPLITDWPLLAPDVLGPLHVPKHPLRLARFGLDALFPADLLAKSFRTEKARGLWAGMAAHAIQPLGNLATSAVGLVLLTQAHLGGWPATLGGSQNLADALAGYFISLGGQIQTGFLVESLAQLPSAKTVLFDITPRQLLRIAGHRFSPLYKKQLERYRYGMGVFKIDWALDEAAPFTAEECRKAGTVHLGGTLREISDGEKASASGEYPEKPFVLYAQQSVFDPTRAPEGKQVAWAYCHVPHGSKNDMTETIERQVERFAPGFRERILARATMNTEQLEAYNSNYIGGDINGGVLDIAQLFTRPALRWSPYRTSAKGLYICSSSTPPGGGVHGMCGFYAAKKALRDVFGETITLDKTQNKP